MPDSGLRPALSAIRYVIVAAFGFAALAVVLITWHWPLIWDQQVFHYGNFLIAHGFAPYRDILDFNLPGIYLVDSWAVKVFGPGDLAWRMFEFVLLAMLCLAMTTIARVYDWVAGVFAGMMFCLVHVSEGPQSAGQRDEIMAVLMILAYAFLFESRRQQRPWMMLFFGMALGLATSIKPTAAPLGLVLLAMFVWDKRRHNRQWAAFIGYSLLGAALAAIPVAIFLSNQHATAALIAITRQLTPFYASLGRPPLRVMIRVSLPVAALVLLPCAVAVAVGSRAQISWERLALLLGAGFGALSYFVQGKGFAYHRYTATAFLFLWMAIILTEALRDPGWRRGIAVAALSVSCLALAPWYIYRMRHDVPAHEYTPALEQDLSRLGPSRINRSIQCLDMVDGCLNVLYHLHIVQSTGSMGDLLLFAPENSQEVDSYRERFWKMVQANPPTVFVLSNEWFNRPPTFAKLDEWPMFERYLAENYRVVVTRQFPAEQKHGYRIYVRNGAALPSLSNAHS